MQSLYAGTDSAARGDQVVHDQYVLAVEFLRVIDCKNTLYVRGAILGFLECLLRVVADTAYVGGIHGNTCGFAQRTGNPFRLVVAALAEPMRVQRDGDDQVDVLEEIRLHKVVCGFAGKVVGNTRLLVEFHLVNHVLYVGTFVEEKERCSPLKAGQIAEQFLRHIAPQGALLRAGQVLYAVGAQSGAFVFQQTAAHRAAMRIEKRQQRA